MKGFKDSTKMRSGFKFPETAGFTSSTGKVQQVRGYTRTVVKKAAGGKVMPGTYDGKATTIGDQGNAVELRTRPISESDKQYGGKGPLRPGFATGGALKRAMAAARAKGPTELTGRPVDPGATLGGGRVGGMLGRAVKMARAAPPVASSSLATGLGGGRLGQMIQQAATGPQMRTAIPRAGIARRPLMRADGGRVPDKKPPPKPAPPPPKKSESTAEILRSKRKEQMAELGLKKGGPVVGPIKKGALHKALGIPADKKIPPKMLSKAAHSGSPLMRKRANFAINAKKWNHG